MFIYAKHKEMMLLCVYLFHHPGVNYLKQIIAHKYITVNSIYETY